jgi:tetratricopeptide (TPR) repeat protein
MRRPTTASIDLALASDIAQRDNVRAVLSCAISKIGDTYSIAGRIIDPRTQRIALTESAAAAGRDRVLPALDQLAGGLRRRLGESLATLSTQNVALPQATTNSLEALKLFTDSQRLDTTKAPDTSDLLLEQAIAIDPDFAMAHALLGHSYLLASEPPTRRAGEEHIRKALSLTNRLTTRERLLIEASADDAHGDREKAAAGYRSYLTLYPDDVNVWFRLGWTYMAGLHQAQNAIEAFERALAIDPRNIGAMLNLATCYGGLGQYERAAAAYEKAFAIKPDELLGQYVNNEYGAVLMHLGRAADAEAAFSKMSSQPARRARGLRSLAFLSMFRGHYGDALRLLHEAIALNQAAGSNVSVYRDRMIVVRALLATGKKEEVQRELTQVTALIAHMDFGPEWLASLATVQSRLGNVREGERLVGLMMRSVGNVVAAATTNRSTTREAGFVDVARAELLAAQHKAEDAEAAVAAATARLGSDALATGAYVAAAAGHDDDAAARYTQLIDHPMYIIEAQEDWFQAHLALGAVYERTGRQQDAKRLYERVAELWKDGDPDLIPLRQARARLQALTR